MYSVMLNNVTKIFENNVVGVRNINFKIDKGEFVFILGKSGAGKTTLLKLISRDILPTKGDIFIENEKINQMSNKEIAYLRRRVGTVRQIDYLLKDRNVYDNVAFALQVTEQPKEVIKKSVPAALRIVGLKKKAYSFPNELSGGERFKAILARALVSNPKMVIADEPTANLDSDTAWDIMCLFDEINRLGITVIIATHAKELVNIMRKRVITLYGGEVKDDIKNGRYDEDDNLIKNLFFK